MSTGADPDMKQALRLAEMVEGAPSEKHSEAVKDAIRKAKHFFGQSNPLPGGTDAVLEAIANAVPSARPANGVFVPQSVWDWLMGEGEDFEPSAAQRASTFGPGHYWWRSELRRRIDAVLDGPAKREGQ